MTLKRSTLFIGTLLSILLPAGVALAAGSGSTVPPVSLLSDHILGRRNANILMIEYADFQCPFCKKQDPVMWDILKKNRRNVSWVYRHYPLSFHQYATSSAIAAECAQAVGGRRAFWDFGHALFLKDNFTEKNYPTVAAELKLDRQAFADCVTTTRFDAKIQAQMQGGQAAGVQGTPTVFLISKTGEVRSIIGATSAEEFQRNIDEMLANVKK